jgi:hypothetical protein
MRRLPLLVLMLGVLPSGLVGAMAAPGATLTPVSGIMRYVVVDPGKQWMDDQGILHQRGARMRWEARKGEGDFVGTGIGVYNADIDPTTGNGKTQGFHSMDLSLGEMGGSFAGHADNTITGFVMSGRFNAPHATGDFKGMKLRLKITIVWGSGIAKYEGFIHSPHK